MNDLPPPTHRQTRRGFFGLAGRAGALGAAAATGALAASSPAAAATTSGLELGYAETTTPAVTSSAIGVPNLVLVIGPQDRPFAVEYGGYVSSVGLNGVVKLYLFRDGAVLHEVGCSTPGRNGVGHLHGYKRLPPSTATTTLGVALATGTNGVQVALAAYPTSPAFLQVRTL